MGFLSNLTYFISIAIIIATPITGLVIVLDKWKLRANRDKDAPLPWYIDWSYFLFPVVLIVTVLRTFIAEPYVIPSGSMQPTLYEGDMIIANKWSFGWRYPLTNKRIFSSREDGIERGDIAIFKYPVDEKINYVKRIVGIPGDVIDYKHKELTINGEPLEYTFVGQARAPENEAFIIQKEKMPIADKKGETEEYREYLIQQFVQETYADHGFNRDGTPLEIQFPITIPKGKYLAMGDNRDNSLDSRFWGFVDDDQILAKANYIWMNYNCILKFKDCNRIFTKLK